MRGIQVILLPRVGRSGLGYPGCTTPPYPGVVPYPAVHHPYTTLGTPSSRQRPTPRCTGNPLPVQEAPLTRTVTERQITDAGVTVTRILARAKRSLKQGSLESDLVSPVSLLVTESPRAVSRIKSRKDKNRHFCHFRAKWPAGLALLRCLFSTLLPPARLIPELSLDHPRDPE